MITNTKEYVRMMKNGIQVPNRIVDLATYVVDNDCLTTSGEPIVGAARTNLIEEVSWNMLIGSRSDKNLYVLTGVIIGVAVAVGTIAALKINKLHKEKRA